MRVLLSTFALVPIVSISAPAATPAQLDATIEGCNQVLEGKCTGGEEGLWQATVIWSTDEERRAYIQIDRKTEDGLAVEHFSRHVDFSANDPLEQSYRAVGLIIAAYVVAMGPEPPPTAPPANQEPEDLAAVPPSEPLASDVGTEPRPPRWGWDASLTMGGAWASTPAPLGASLRPFWLLHQAAVRVSADLRWVPSGGLARAHWLSFAPGVSFALSPSRWPLRSELRLQAGLMSVLIEATREGQKEKASALRFGARAGLDVAVPLSLHSALLLGGDLGFWSPKLRLDVASEQIGETSLPELQGFVGVRFEL